MSEEQALIDLCLCQPEDDFPKLILADWLEDDGRTLQAWRIRTYLRIYRPTWQQTLLWDQERDADATENLIRRVLRKRNDELWRLVELTMLYAVLERYPPRLDAFRWPEEWDVPRFLRTLAEARCQVMFRSYGLDTNLRNAEQAALRAWSAAAGSTRAAHAAQAVRWTAATRRPRIAALAAVWEIVGAGNAAWSEDAERAVWSATYSLWRHVHDTLPNW